MLSLGHTGLPADPGNAGTATGVYRGVYRNATGVYRKLPETAGSKIQILDMLKIAGTYRGLPEIRGVPGSAVTLP